MSWGTRVLVALIRFYQLAVSPWLGRACRFEPSCSRYASACIVRFGVVRGSLLSGKRLCKCHPFHPGGFDPPPVAPTGELATAPVDAEPRARTRKSSNGP